MAQTELLTKALGVGPLLIGFVIMVRHGQYLAASFQFSKVDNLTPLNKAFDFFNFNLSLI